MIRFGFLYGLTAWLCYSAQVPAAHADFSGTWHQDISSSVPQPRSKTGRDLTIEQAGNVLHVQIATTKTGEVKRTLDLRYEIGGPELVYKGLDGDEFHTKVWFDGESLVFETVEHERGTEIASQETWTLAEGGTRLKDSKTAQRGGQAVRSLAVFVKDRDR